MTSEARFTRTTDGHGTVTLTGTGGSMVVTRPVPGVVVVALRGHDRGDVGAAIFDELRADVVRYPPVRLFIDLSGSSGATVAVQDEWSAWFAANRRALHAVHVLATGSYLHFAAELVKRWSRTDDLIRVHTDAASYAAALTAATRGTPASSAPSGTAS
jgi:hypothetical protein